VGELVVGSLDLEHHFPRRDRIAVVQRAHLQRRPVIAAKLEDGDRFVDAAEQGVLLGEHLHGDMWRGTVASQHITGAGEVFVGVVAGPHLVDRQVEDGGIEAGSGHSENLRWRTEDGGWRMEDGGWRVTEVLYPPSSILLL
jgi:hypothetical protein